MSLHRRLAVLAGIALLSGTMVSADDCPVSSEQEGIRFPVERLEAASRCLISPVVKNFTTMGTIGPSHTPISPELFGYFLDHPIVWGALVDRLALGKYKFIDRGHRQYWVNDGEGTQGLLTEIYRDESAWIYHLDGYHEGSVTPRVAAEAVVFVRLQPALTSEGESGVQSTLVAYTKLKGAVLDALVRLLRPLVSGVVTRKLTRGIDITSELGILIAKDPGRVSKEVDRLSGVDADDLKTLRALLKAVPGPAQPSMLLRTTP